MFTYTQIHSQVCGLLRVAMCVYWCSVSHSLSGSTLSVGTSVPGRLTAGAAGAAACSAFAGAVAALRGAGIYNQAEPSFFSALAQSASRARAGGSGKETTKREEERVTSGLPPRGHAESSREGY